MKTYQFQVVVEPDEDRWIAYCPALATKGAATWGYTRAEALENIQVALELVLETMTEKGLPIPVESLNGVLPPEERLVVSV